VDAIVGLRQSGKSTVFQALTAGHGSAAASGGEHMGVLNLPDARLQRLGELVRAKKITPHSVTLHDLPPLFERGAAPSGEVAQTLTQSEALIHVVRAFRRDDVPHPQGSVNPERDIRAFEAELLLHDLGIIERRLEKLDIIVRSGRPAEREAGEREKQLLERCKHLLDDEKPLRGQIDDAQDRKALANFAPLSFKPMLVLLNVDESDIASTESIETEYSAKYAAPQTAVAAISAKLETELAELTSEEAEEFRRELGTGAGAMERVLVHLQQLLGLITFFTAGEKETRAWTIPAGSTALQAAAQIHTDIEKGFIRAEVIAWDKLLDLGSHAEAKKHGQLRTEGKQYLMQDGDVINVLFNV
jgi:GTP-binding protein YchF